MSSNFKPLVALGLTAVGAMLVANFQVADAPLAVADASTDATTTTTVTKTTVATKRSAATAAPTTAAAAPSTATAEPGGATTPTPTPTPATASSDALYADGTYSGASIGEPWGTFKVQVTISGGQITDVSLVSEPRDRHSSSINSQAVPMLTEEAISAQSSNIDMLSGATWTSDSYINSLQAALDDAAAAQTAG